MTESPTVKKWIEEGEAKGIAKGEATGEVKGRAASVLRLLSRFGPVPEDIAQMVRAGTTPEQFDAWLDLTLQVKDFDDFRNRATPANP